MEKFKCIDEKNPEHKKVIATIEIDDGRKKLITKICGKCFFDAMILLAKTR